MPAQEQLIPVSVIALVEDQNNASPIVVLHDKISNRLLPVWIGDPEARAIAMALDNTKAPRPLTHTLLINVLGRLGFKLNSAVVDRLLNHTFYASLYVENDKGSVKIDCRPSDAIALALEAGAPIFAAKSVMDAAGQMNPIPANLTTQEKRAVGLKDLKADEILKLKEMLDRARRREQQSTPPSGGAIQA